MATVQFKTFSKTFDVQSALGKIIFFISRVVKFLKFLAP